MTESYLRRRKKRRKGRRRGDGGRAEKDKKKRKKKKNEHINIRNYPKERSMNVHKDLSTRIFMALLTTVENWKIKQGLITQKHEN